MSPKATVISEMEINHRKCKIMITGDIYGDTRDNPGAFEPDVINPLSIFWENGEELTSSEYDDVEEMIDIIWEYAIDNGKYELIEKGQDW